MQLYKVFKTSKWVVPESAEIGRRKCNIDVKAVPWKMLAGWEKEAIINIQIRCSDNWSLKSSVCSAHFCTFPLLVIMSSEATVSTNTLVGSNGKRYRDVPICSIGQQFISGPPLIGTICNIICESWCPVPVWLPHQMLVLYFPHRCHMSPNVSLFLLIH